MLCLCVTVIQRGQVVPELLEWQPGVPFQEVLQEELVTGVKALLEVLKQQHVKDVVSPVSCQYHMHMLFPLLGKRSPATLVLLHKCGALTLHSHEKRMDIGSSYATHRSSRSRLHHLNLLITEGG